MAQAEALDRRALYACTRPWTSAIRHLGPLQRELDEHSSSKLSDPRALWIRCYPPGGMMGTLAPISQQCLEGLALLTILARVDADLWRSELNHIWGEDSWSGDKTRAFVYGELTRLTSGPQAETFTVGLALTVSKREHLQSATTQCLSVESFSADMQRVLKLLKVKVSLEDETIRIPIKYLMDYEDADEDVADALQAIAELKRSECGRNATNARFKISCVSQSMTYPDTRALELMVQLRAMGVRLDGLPPLSETCTSLDDAVRLTTALRALLLPSPAELGDLREPGIDTVTISAETSPELVDAVLSAVECSSIVKTVHLNLDAGMRVDHSVFHIVARTLFSGHARHRVKNLSVSVDRLSDTSVELVLNVLAADYTSSFAYPQNRRQGPAMRLTSSRFHMRPVKGAARRKGKGDVVYESPMPLELQVKRTRFASNGRQWLSVTLPGRGEAWVEQHDILASTEYEDEYRTVARTIFDKIVITTMSDSSKSNVAVLLERIAHATRSLHVLQYEGLDPIDDWMDALLDSCLNIQDVELGYVPMNSLEPFVQRVGNPLFPLRRLAFPGVGFHPRQMQSFLRALSSPNHLLGMHLEELIIRLRTGGDDSDEEFDDYDDDDEDEDMEDDGELEEILAPVVRMLDKNRTLRKVVLCFRLSGHEEDSEKETIEEIFERFMDEDQEPWIPAGPLDEASTLAFLSVFHGESSVQPAIVETSILTTILQYAAPRVQREFNLEIRAEDSY